MKNKSLNKKVESFNIHGFELDELLDQQNWNGNGGKIFHMFKNNKFIEEFYSIKEAKQYAYKHF